MPKHSNNPINLTLTVLLWGVGACCSAQQSAETPQTYGPEPGPAINASPQPAGQSGGYGPESTAPAGPNVAPPSYAAPRNYAQSPPLYGPQPGPPQYGPFPANSLPSESFPPIQQPASVPYSQAASGLPSIPGQSPIPDGQAQMQSRTGNWIPPGAPGPAPFVAPTQPAVPPITMQVRPQAVMPQPSTAQSNSASAWSTLSFVRQLVKAGKAAQALPLSESFIQQKPFEPEGYFWQGVILDNLDQPEQALQRFQAATERVVAAGMDSAEVRMNAGNTLLKLGRIDEAIDAYRRAVQVDPGLALAQLNLGRAYIEKGNYEEALRCFQHCDESHFAPLQLAYYRTKALQKCGRSQDARACLQSALSKVPESEVSRNMRREFAELLHN